MELGKLLEIRKLVQQDPPSHHAPVVMCTVKDRAQESAVVVKMVALGIVLGDVVEVVIQRVKVHALDVTLHVQESAKVVEMDVPLVVAEDVMEVVILHAKIVARDATLHVQESAKVVKMVALEIVKQLVKALVLVGAQVDVMDVQAVPVDV